jgi:hypothetical protein
MQHNCLFHFHIIREREGEEGDSTNVRLAKPTKYTDDLEMELLNLLSFLIIHSSGAFHDHFPIYSSGTCDQRRQHVDSLQHCPVFANGDGRQARYGPA